eukprot:CAMPEP_0206458550 /NCGR_PEP_ID=MMETSP0324_2-20121206/23637_1 /ASSEMBLY_ACC=CAM_ASM_000836 /TAXON_ID=2866 /ORGANISM="Crypthecodinium cohnii, Strain Seligo" /LENGTH=184 /DNA_ID=CAMNT_0053929911 /DNA_START=202 /DNA_END=759 /DNA_ORIENTATION=-
MSTHAIGGSAAMGAPYEINSRIVESRPLENFTDIHDLKVIYIDTNKWSRKYKEILEAKQKYGSARMSLMYFDAKSYGYVSLRGSASIASDEEAKAVWYEPWKAFYPQGKDTPFYCVVKFFPDWLEISGGPREKVDSNRTDWLPVSLQRPSLQSPWRIVVHPETGLSEEGELEQSPEASLLTIHA